MSAGSTTVPSPRWFSQPRRWPRSRWSRHPRWLPRPPWLPRGLDLPEAAWRTRHRAVLISLAALALVVLAASVADRSPSGALAGAPPMVLVGAAAARTCAARRGVSAGLAVLGLSWGAASVVLLTGGLAEAHFLFFLVVAAAALYQGWAPFVVCAVFLLSHYAVLGILSPELLYDRAAALRHPWVWSGMHVALLGLAMVMGLAAWIWDERVRAELGDVASRNELLMETLGDGLVAVGASGRVVSANPTAESLLGTAWETLVGRDLRDHLTGVDVVLAEFAALAPAEGTPLRRRRWTSETVTAVPVELTVIETRALGDVAAVVTLRDLSLQLRADEAERRLATAVRREATQRRDVSGLAAAIRPYRLAVPGLELGMVYEPAESSPAGGDLYDWFALPDGSVQVTVVDAMGRGLGATRQALSVTATLRTLTLSGVPLDDLVASADAVLSHLDPDLVATVVVVRYDPATGAAQVVSGGHPPVLHVCGTGTAYAQTYGVPIGYPGAGSDGHADLVLAEGDLLLLYSDGMVEGTRDLTAGLDALAMAAGDLRACPPQEVAERLLAELPTVARAEDDCLLLALQRTPPVTVAPAGVADAAVAELRLLPEFASARRVRRHATSFAEDHHLDPQVTDALVLVISELTSNAIAHAETPFTVRLQLVDSQVRGSVRDDSTRMPVVQPSRIDGVTGRGLLIIDRLTRAWGVNAGPSELGKTVWFTLDAAAPRS